MVQVHTNQKIGNRKGKERINAKEKIEENEKIK
jgi:hypothetical protein